MRKAWIYCAVTAAILLPLAIAAPVAVEVFDDADAETAAVSVFGNSSATCRTIWGHCVEVAASGTGNASATCAVWIDECAAIALSGTGNATAGCLNWNDVCASAAVAPLGSASAMCGTHTFVACQPVAIGGAPGEPPSRVDIGPVSVATTSDASSSCTELWGHCVRAAASVLGNSSASCDEWVDECVAIAASGSGNASARCREWVDVCVPIAVSPTGDAHASCDSHVFVACQPVAVSGGSEPGSPPSRIDAGPASVATTENASSSCTELWGHCVRVAASLFGNASASCDNWVDECVALAVSGTQNASARCTDWVDVCLPVAIAPSGSGHASCDDSVFVRCQPVVVDSGDGDGGVPSGVNFGPASVATTGDASGDVAISLLGNSTSSSCGTVAAGRCIGAAVSGTGNSTRECAGGTSFGETCIQGSLSILGHARSSCGSASTDVDECDSFAVGGQSASADCLGRGFWAGTCQAVAASPGDARVFCEAGEGCTAVTLGGSSSEAYCGTNETANMDCKTVAASIAGNARSRCDQIGFWSAPCQAIALSILGDASAECGQWDSFWRDTCTVTAISGTGSASATCEGFARSCTRTEAVLRDLLP